MLALSLCWLVMQTGLASWLVLRLNGSPVLQDENGGEINLTLVSVTRVT